MDTEKAIAKLREKPDKFLTNHGLIIGTFVRIGEAGLARFKMSDQGRYWKADHVGNVTSPDVKLAPDEFLAWYIPMQQLQSFQVDRLPQDDMDLALTTTLSGCIFGIGHDASGTVVAHIQPPLAKDNANPQKALRKGLKSAGLSEAFGAQRPEKPGALYDPKTTVVTVVGKREDNAWTFWAQTREKGHSQEITGLWHTL